MTGHQVCGFTERQVPLLPLVLLLRWVSVLLVATTVLFKR